MSKDPFEELFGPAGQEEVGQTQPVPARERLAYEQAERVRTAQLPYASDGGGGAVASRDRSAQAKPWIIVGFIALIAIVVSIIVINALRGGEPPVADGNSTNTTTSQSATSTPPATQTEQPTTDSPKPEQTEKPEKPGDEPPVIDPGQTFTMPIGPWNATSQLSARFGATNFAIPDGTNLILSSDLLNQFPASCEAMSKQWGAKRLDDGTYEVLRPAGTCTENPALYDEVWGLTAAWVKTINPA